MPISPDLHGALLKVLGVSPATLSRQASDLVKRYGPMTGDEARWIIAHDAGIDLRRYGLTATQLDRVRQLRGAIGQYEGIVGRGRTDPKPAPAPASAPA